MPIDIFKRGVIKLRWVCVVRMKMKKPWLSKIVKNLIQLCECSGCSESSLGAYVQRYIFWRYGSINNFPHFFAVRRHSYNSYNSTSITSDRCWFVDISKKCGKFILYHFSAPSYKGDTILTYTKTKYNKYMEIPRKGHNTGIQPCQSTE